MEEEGGGRPQLVERLCFVPGRQRDAIVRALRRRDVAPCPQKSCPVDVGTHSGSAMSVEAVQYQREAAACDGVGGIYAGIAVGTDLQQCVSEVHI